MRPVRCRRAFAFRMPGHSGARCRSLRSGDGAAARQPGIARARRPVIAAPDLRRGSRRRSEEHTSELQSLMRISYAVFCLKKTTQIYINSLTAIAGTVGLFHYIHL